MVIEPAGRLVTWPAGHVRQSFDYRCERIEWRPMPWAGRPEDTDGLRAHGCGDMNQTRIVRYAGAGAFQRQDGVAEIRRGEIASSGSGGGNDLGGEGAFRRTAQHPDRAALRGEIAGEVSEIPDRPAFARTYSPRRECDHWSAIVREPSRGAPFAGLLRRDVEFRFG